MAKMIVKRDRIEANRKLRDENIRIAEERGRPDLIQNFQDAIDLGFTASEIRKKLRR